MDVRQFCDRVYCLSNSKSLWFCHSLDFTFQRYSCIRAHFICHSFLGVLWALLPSAQGISLYSPSVNGREESYWNNLPRQSYRSPPQGSVSWNMAPKGHVGFCGKLGVHPSEKAVGLRVPDSVGLLKSRNLWHSQSAPVWWASDDFLLANSLKHCHERFSECCKDLCLSTTVISAVPGANEEM